MEPEVRERFEQAEARMAAAEKRAERAEARSIRSFERAKQRMKLAEERMDRFDKQLQATRKLVELGMRILVRLESRMDDLAKFQKTFLASRSNGRNGKNGHTRRRT
jgi:hypothetical protein